MKKIVRMSIKNKLFLIITAVLSINIIVILLFGVSFLEQYYISTKKRELDSYHKQIEISYQKEDYQSINYALQNCTINNITILLLDTSSKQIIYSSARPGKDNDNPDVQLWLSRIMQQDILSQLEVEDPIIEVNDYNTDGDICLYSKMDDSTYLLMDTPLAYITATAQTAMQFFLILSFFTLVIGLTVTYLVSKRIAKPIKEIDNTARRISNMDFSQRCDIHTGDEIEVLATSVNSMADDLEKNIALLKNNLIQVEQANRAHKLFVANVSHDFKTPLSLITAYSEALKDGTYTDVDEICDILLEQSDRMNHMVNQLLTLSQLESGTIRFDFRPFAINDLILSSIKNFEILLKKQGIQLQVHLVEDIIVQGDYNRILQVFTNLFENAIKYVDNAHLIQIWSVCKANHIRIHLCNSHAPIEQEELYHLFEMFYKSDKSRNAKKNSYGIGLAIVKNILDAHHQKYGVYNAEKGIVFWFELEKICFDEADDNVHDL